MNEYERFMPNQDDDEPILPEDCSDTFFPPTSDAGTSDTSDESDAAYEKTDDSTEREKPPVDGPVSANDSSFSESVQEEIRTAKRLYPDLKEVPEEVARAVANGSRFLPAYETYRARQSVRETDQLRKEIETLRHNQDVLFRAPVRGVSGGGATRTDTLDPFLRGLDAEGW